MSWSLRTSAAREGEDTTIPSLEARLPMNGNPLGPGGREELLSVDLVNDDHPSQNMIGKMAAERVASMAVDTSMLISSSKYEIMVVILEKYFG
ncbi:hypothetical protein OIU85_019533 [Salix viminalis]|uniref:Uncharacterized protein n=1 Tax=Salix viminalis TaxID=40686 RepID=A0A9Q0UWR8_SALVM|nr:hypothetical protein OIU85_019533 [Salix viminalis]